MSEPDDIVEREGGAFRTSANEDPHGTRATAMALPSAVQRMVSEKRPVLSLLVLGATTAPHALAMLGSVLIGASSPWALILFAVWFGFLFFIARWVRGGLCLEFTSRSLRVVERTRTRDIPWRDVEQLELSAMNVRASIRSGRAREEVIVRLPQVSPKAAARLARMAAPVFVGGPDVELARGSRIAIAVAAASVGAILAAFGTWVGVAIGHDAIGWIVGLALLYLAMTAWTLARSRVIARSSGLWVNGKLIPWPAIEDAQAGNAQGKERSSQVRVRIADADELTVSVGADAERAVEEIRRRRDLARDEVARQKHPERAQSTPR